MGMRSQIYIRYRNEKGTQLIARYFQWNYSERMVSRARGVLETLESTLAYYNYYFNTKEFAIKMARICDVNFDMRDIVFSSDILKEVHDYFLENGRKNGFNQYIFGQDNNDGQLLIDVVPPADEDDPPFIKYAFLEYYTTPEKIMDGNGYMQMDAGKDWKKKKRNSGEPNKSVRYTVDNIKRINDMATLMTVDEVKDFISDDYSHLIEENYNEDCA